MGWVPRVPFLFPPFFVPVLSQKEVVYPLFPSYLCVHNEDQKTFELAEILISDRRRTWHIPNCSYSHFPNTNTCTDLWPTSHEAVPVGSNCIRNRVQSKSQSSTCVVCLSLPDRSRSSFINGHRTASRYHQLATGERK